MPFEACDIEKNKLPTNQQVMEYFLYIKKNGASNIKKNQTLVNYIHVITNMVCELWKYTNIPIVCKSTIRRHLKNLLMTYKDIVKNPSKYDSNEMYWNKLFEISKCKCGIENNSDCLCSENEKIPPNMVAFFIDQSGPRLLTFDDIQVDNMEIDMIDQGSSIAGVNQSPFTVSYAPGSGEETESDDENNDVSPNEEQLKVSNISLNNYAVALDRTNTSDSTGSLLATTLIKDLKHSIARKASKDYKGISERMLSFLDDLVIDRNKIRREREKFRAEVQAASTSEVVLQCISYDGKKDATLKKEASGSKGRCHKIIEEHITIIKEPESTFVGYTTPTAGTGEEIQKAIVNFLDSKGFSLDYLVANNCDGTAVNTGYKSGVNACMERYLQRPLQWNICLLHFNELPLKGLLTNLLGKQIGPGIWPTELGSELLSCTEEPVSFLSIYNIQICK